MTAWTIGYKALGSNDFILRSWCYDYFARSAEQSRTLFYTVNLGASHVIYRPIQVRMKRMP